MPKLETISRSGASAADQGFEQRIGIGQGREARQRERGNVADRGLVDLGQRDLEIGRAVDRHVVLVGDRQRMVGQRHFEPGQRAPAAADHVEGPARRRAFEARAGHRLGDLARERGLAFLGERVEAQHAERQRGAAPDPAARDLDQLEAAAAEIADDPVRVGNGGEHALPRPLPFLLAREDARLEAELAHAGEEGGAVRGLAHRGGGDDAGADHASSAGPAGGSGRARRAPAPAPPRPISPTSRPSPASTFSLKMTEGMRLAPE